MKDNILLKDKVINATKWSFITELMAKLINPIMNMILARILMPEAFGVVVMVTMIISFADMIKDSGFQKYIIQHDFKDKEELYIYANIAFWTNLVFSIVLWVIILIFNEEIAWLVGNARLGHVIVIAGFQLIITSFSGIQTAIFNRKFDFKTLFLVRMVSLVIPLLVTLPMALIGFDYWALIIGTLTIQLTNAIVLTIKSDWKPKLYYSFSILKEMLSFSMWSILEAISIWLTLWVDTFIIGYVLNQYYTGLYKTSVSMVNSIMDLVRSSVLPILFTTLARLQQDKVQFTNMFYKFQKLFSYILLPIGVGVFLYQNLVTSILLGSKWNEASKIIGIWALTRSIKSVFGDLSSEVYRSSGRPKLSFIAQILHLMVLIPTCILSSRFGFWIMIYSRSWIQMQFVLVHLFIMHFVMKISLWKTIKCVIPPAVASALMYLLGWLLKSLNHTIPWDFLSILLCAVFYFAVLTVFSDSRKELSQWVKRLRCSSVYRKLRLDHNI